MSTVKRLTLVIDRCIGCQACTHRCPADLIRFSDKDGVRTLEVAITCAEDCTRCADVCSESAISLEPTDKVIEGFFTAQFPLLACKDCGTPYATEKMVVKLNASIPALLVPGERNWLSTCLGCRRTDEAKRIAGRGLLNRVF